MTQREVALAQAAAIAAKWKRDLIAAGDQFDKDGDIYAGARIAEAIEREITQLAAGAHSR